MDNKLAVSIPVYWLTIPSATNRHQHMINQFFQYGIESHSLVTAYDLTTIRNRVPTARYLDNIDNQTISIMLSHLKIIKKFYYESTAEMALIFEDDISFELSKYWNFTLSNIIDRLSINWNLIQLCLIRDDDIDTIKFRRMKNCDWSLAAYMISKKYAKILIDCYCKENDEYDVNYVTSHLLLIPNAESVLFSIGINNMYTFPIFTENISISSTKFDMGFNEVANHPSSVKSFLTVSNWWETHGLTKNLDYFFQ